MHTKNMIFHKNIRHSIQNENMHFIRIASVHKNIFLNLYFCLVNVGIYDTNLVYLTNKISKNFRFYKPNIII